MRMFGLVVCGEEDERKLFLKELHDSMPYVLVEYSLKENTYTAKIETLSIVGIERILTVVKHSPYDVQVGVTQHCDSPV